MVQKGKSRNVLASPLGEEGHEVAKGVQANWIHRGAPRPANPVRRHPAKSVCARVRMIMILLFYVLSPFAQGAADWRSGPRWSILSVLCPVHPFATTWHFPSRGNERYGEKNRASYTSCTIPVCSPFGGCRHHLARWEACHMTQKGKSRNADFISIAAERQSTTLGPKGRQTYEP